MEHCLDHADAEPGQSLPVLHNYGVNDGVCQQFSELGAFVVEATGDFGDDVIEDDAVLSGVCP